MINSVYLYWYMLIKNQDDQKNQILKSVVRFQSTFLISQSVFYKEARKMSTFMNSKKGNSTLLQGILKHNIVATNLLAD